MHQPVTFYPLQLFKDKSSGMKKSFILLLLTLFGASLKAAIVPSNLIAHAQAAPQSILFSHERLSSYLASAAKTEEEKVLIFCYWIGKNIRYDMQEVRHQNRTNKTPFEVLRNKKAVCEGFSILFQQFCANEGIESYVVYGHGYGNFLRRTFSICHMRHAWNSVYIDGKWKILDVTWAGAEIRRGDFNKTKNLEWIFMDAAEFSKSHYPNDPRWQLLKNPRSKQEFWQEAKTISEKNYAIEDSLEVLLKRERYLNELIICKSEFDAQADEHTYLRNLIHLGWKYVGGAYNEIKVNQGIEIFSFAEEELSNLQVILDKLLYQPNIEKGIYTAQIRLETEK